MVLRKSEVTVYEAARAEKFKAENTTKMELKKSVSTRLTKSATQLKKAMRLVEKKQHSTLK